MSFWRFQIGLSLASVTLVGGILLKTQVFHGDNPSLKEEYWLALDAGRALGNHSRDVETCLQALASRSVTCRSLGCRLALNQFGEYCLRMVGDTDSYCSEIPLRIAPLFTMSSWRTEQCHSRGASGFFCNIAMMAPLEHCAKSL